MTRKDAEYPYNLLMVAFDTDHIDPLSDDQLAGVEKAISLLSEREAKVIHERYQNKLKLDQIGNIFNISRERVRQIESKALRKLRHPKYRIYIDNGLHGTENMNKLFKMEKSFCSCPFCGDYPRLVSVDTDLYYLECTCGVRTKADTYLNLTNFWNTRAHKLIRISAQTH